MANGKKKQPKTEKKKKQPKIKKLLHSIVEFFRPKNIKTRFINMMTDQRKRVFFFIGLAGFVAYFFVFLIVCHAAIAMENNPEYSFLEGLRYGLAGFGQKMFRIFPIPARAFSMMLLITFLAALLIFALAMRAKMMKHYNPDEALGDAHFLTDKELRAYNMKCTEPFGSPYAEGNKNVILAKGFELSMNNKMTNRNVNMINVAGSGRGKTFRFVVPNLLQANASFVCTDPSGGIFRDYGHFFEEMGYKIKTLNLSHMERSNHYNPFRYIRSDKDIAVLVDMLIANTTPPGSHSGDPFWEKSEANAFNAIIALQWHYLGEKDRNYLSFKATANLIRMLDVSEEDSGKSVNKLDDIFKYYENQDPGGYAFTQYKNLMSAAGKTIKSIVASCLARIRSFDLEEVATLTSDDDIDLEAVGDEKTALFVIIPTGEKTFNFIASMMYSQLFTRLYDYCENEAFFSQVVKDKDGEVVRVFRANSMEESKQKNMLARIYVEDLKKARIVQNGQFDKEKGGWYEIHMPNGEFVTYRRSLKQAEIALQKLKESTVCKNGEYLPIHTRLMLDEFANIGGIPDFDTKVSTIRKYGISVTIILQSLEQIKKAYKNDWSTICSNCDNIIYMGGGADPETTKWFAELIGKETRKIMSQSYSTNKSGNTSINSQGIELAAAAKLRTLKDKELVILPTAMMPYKGVMYEPMEHPNWKFVGTEKYEFDRAKTNYFNMAKKTTKYILETESAETAHGGLKHEESEEVEIHKTVFSQADAQIAEEMTGNASVTGEEILENPVTVANDGKALKRTGVKSTADIQKMAHTFRKENLEMADYYTKFVEAPIDRKRREKRL